MRLRDRTRKARVEMLPLMDVVFLLLVFFIYSMLLMAVHRGMPLALPESEAAEHEPASTLALSVMADGSLFLDKEPVALKGLAAVLGQAVAGQEKGAAVSLQVFADGALPYQDLYRVLDAVKEAGVRNISLQAREKDAP